MRKNDDAEEEEKECGEDSALLLFVLTASTNPSAI